MTTASNVTASMPPAREIVRREIAACGPITFARFMELSLYCPESGYYEQLTNTPGRHGDFYTSVSVGGLFGQLLGFQFARWLSESEPGKGAQLLEAGAHDGRLAADVLDWIRARRPAVFDSLEYWILEPSLRRREWQARTLASYSGKVRWFENWEQVPESGVQGIIFSNELLDAMPAHRLGWDAAAGEWFEWTVALDRGQFAWRRSRLSIPLPAHWRELAAGLAGVLPDGFSTEIAPGAAAWWSRAAAALRRGRLLTFDYGLDAAELFQPQRAGGTLRAFYRHQWNEDLLARAGEQDLTAQVDFTSLERAGVSAGLQTERLGSQAQFLTAIAAATWEPDSDFGEWPGGRTRQFQTLTHPDHLGRRHRVLVQRR